MRVMSSIGIHKNTKKGFYTVEAAIFLPIFIVAVLTLAYLIKIVGATEVLMHNATDEARHMAAMAYVEKINLGNGTKIENRIKADCDDISWIEVTKLIYLYENSKNDGLISFDMEYEIPIKLPLNLYDGFTMRDRVLCRGWIGKECIGTPKMFEDMEKIGEGRTVWIFPKAGRKYHTENCPYITNVPEQRLLNKEIMRKYKPCKHCNAKDLPKGSLVYCYPKYGEVYHGGGCDVVEKYVIPIDEEDAKSKGYTPCSNCGG